MNTNLDWLKILVECRENVKVKIRHLEKSKQPLSDLGIGAGGDPIKLVDLVAEKAIVEVIQKYCMPFTLISEESGIKRFSNDPNKFFLTVDPIDGTTNLVHNLPFYCSSIAVSRQPSISKVFAALVGDLHNNVSYAAIEKKGAFRDDKRIAPSSTVFLDEAVIGLDLDTYKIGGILPQLNDFLQQTKHLRHFGANALEICYVADGKTDAFVDLRGKIRTTDVAAAFLILKEAGGVVSTPEGKPIEMKLDPKQTLKFVASGNKEIHQKILSLLTPRKETRC